MNIAINENKFSEKMFLIPFLNGAQISYWSQDLKILSETGSDIHCRLFGYILFAIITGNLFTRSATAISPNFVQTKTI